MLIKGKVVHRMLGHPVNCRSNQYSRMVQNAIHSVPFFIVILIVVIAVIVRTVSVFNVVFCVGGILDAGISICGDGARCRLN